MKRSRRWPKGTCMRLRSPQTLILAMHSRQLSMRRLAAGAECSKSFISHLTSGRRKNVTPALAQRISEALGYPLEMLFMPVMTTVDKQNGKQCKTTAGGRATRTPQRKPRSAA